MTAYGRIAPVVLGCCPDRPRCLLCPPPPRRPTPEKVAALVGHYEARGSVAVGFYGGPPPDEALVEASGGRPLLVRVRPDLLTRADAMRLVAGGAVALELDALTFDDDVLRGVGRKYTARLLREMATGLGALGLRTGVVLAPGLPGTDHTSAVRDATIAASLFDTARIHPVLVIVGSRLRELHAAGRYPALELGQAVTTCRAMMDTLEAGGVEVIRVGVQPGPDEVGRAVAGPRHPSLRELVEARRTLDHLRGRFEPAHRGRVVVLRCSPRDETRTRGPFNQHIRSLRAEFSLAGLEIRPDPALPRGRWEIEVA